MISRFIRQFAIKGWQLLRGVWMIVGISILMFVLAETCYRAQDTVRTAISNRGARSRSSSATPSTQPAARHPVANEKWFPEFAREFEESSPQAWRPYVYFRRAKAYHGQYVNIDSQQHRVTPQPHSATPPLAKVFFFGGSTMWGSFLRDDHTIAAEASRRLQAIAPPGQRYEVTNLGETGHVNTQGMLELMLQLRSGQRPDVVVFYDGINDAFSVLQNGIAGVGQNEMNRVSEFTTGRRLAWGGHDEGIVKDLHSYVVLGGLALERTGLVRRLRKAVTPTPTPPLLSVDSASRSAVRVYVENARMIESLARTYGFTAIYVWQPTIHASEKVFTPFERRLVSRIQSDPLQKRLREVHRAMLPMLDSAMASVANGRFVNEGGLFKGDTIPVFSDQVGHNTEVAIPGIVGGFFPTLESAVRQMPEGRAPVIKSGKSTARRG